MDGVSAAASVIALWQITEEIAKFAQDTVKAPEEYRKLRSGLENIRFVLERLQKREEDAQRQPGLTYYEGILQLRHRDGPLKRLRTSSEALKDELNPTEGLRKFETVRRLRYHWDKKKFEEYLNQLDRYSNQISQILDGDQFALSLYSEARIEEIQGKFEIVNKTGEDSNARIKLLQDEASDQSGLLKGVAARMERLELSQQNEQDRLREKEDEQERNEIIRWLSPLKTLEKQQQLLEGSFRSGKWFLDESIEFKKWQEGRHWELRAHGEPGSGKTVLSAFIADYLKKRLPSEKFAVLCIYLEQQNRDNQTPDNLLGDLIKQIIQQNEFTTISEDLKRLYREAIIRETRPSAQEFWEILVDLVKPYARIYLLIDGLDEASIRASDWLQFELPKVQSEKLSIMYTSRDSVKSSDDIVSCDAGQEEDVRLYWRCDTCDAGNGYYDICQKCMDAGRYCKDRSHQLEEMMPVEITVETPSEEIRRYVKEEIDKEIRKANTSDWDPALYAKTRRKGFGGQLVNDKELLERIPQTIAERAGRKFIFAKLSMDSVKLQRTLADIEDALEDLPDSLNKQYEKIINERIKTQESRSDRENSMKILSLVCCASIGRNLRLTELQHALAVRPGDGKLNKRRILTRDDILDLTKGLIAIEYEEDGAVVRPFHLTFQEWFDINRDDWFPSADLDMANACLGYLNLDDLSSPIHVDNYEWRVQEYPFIAYASQEWGNHVRQAGHDMELQATALQYVRNRDRIAAWSQAAWYTKSHGFAGWDVRKAVDGIHVCAWFGLTSLIDEWKKLKEIDINVQEMTYGQTPLMYACRKGHIDTADRLLRLGALPELRSSKGSTALFEAVRRPRPYFIDELDDVKTDVLVDHLLREHEVHINIRDNLGLTALMHATEMQHLQAVRSLLQNPDISVNMQDPGGVTPLSRAVLVNWENGVAVLLGKTDIDVNLAELGGRSPLILAAERDCSSIVLALLDRGAQPELKDLQGATAVMRAISAGATDVVDFLLERNVDIACKDEDNRGLMHAAANNGETEIIHTLHSRGLRLDQRDKFGMTPLHNACQHDNVDMVEALTQLGADMTSEDNFHRTPAMVAWQYGRESVINFFKTRAKECNKKLDMPPEEELPIWSLAMQGLEDCLRTAISSGKADLSANEPITENSAVHCAIQANQNTALRILLSNEAIPYSSCNCRRMTPLHLAAMSGSVEATNLLLAKRPELDAIDQWGQTPLTAALKNRHLEVCVRLIEAGACINPPVTAKDKPFNTVSSQQASIQRLFFAAVDFGSITTTQRLLEAGADILAVNDAGRTAREIAKRSDNEELQKLLSTSRSYLFMPGRRGTIENANVQEAEPAFQGNSGLTASPEGETVNDVIKETAERLRKVRFEGEQDRTESAPLAGFGVGRLKMPFPMPADAKEET
ncbi:MAG: hypothetical protein Q9165_002152 [Trypethelium subeluteriae]